MQRSQPWNCDPDYALKMWEMSEISRQKSPLQNGFGTPTTLDFLLHEPQ